MHEQTTITRLWEAVMLKYACNACDPIARIACEAGNRVISLRW